MIKKLFLLSCFALLAVAGRVQAQTVIDQGDCGPTLTWTLNSIGVLNITGVGEMNDYSEYSSPFYNYRKSITQIIIGGEATSVGGIIEDTPWHDENSVTWNGHTYQYTLDRAADKSLPTVKNELGQPYYDNSITLNVKRDGEVFFARKFTKEAFADFLSDDYKANASLLGLAFDRAADDGLHFGAMVGYAGTEEGGMLFTVVLTADGSVSIIRGEQPDAPGA